MERALELYEYEVAGYPGILNSTPTKKKKLGIVRSRSIQVCKVFQK